MNLPMNSTIDQSRSKSCRVDTVFYQLGKFFWLPFCMAGFWFAQSGYEKYGDLTECAIRQRCGLPCPGCGGTRAFYYLFRGAFFKSIALNPAVIFGVLAYLHFMALYFYRKHISGSLEEKEIHIPYYLYAAVIVILTQWVIKLIRIFSVII